MSYCRCGEDSDVYVWVGTKYEVTFCQGKPGVFEKMVASGLKSQAFETGKETMDFLLKAKSYGFLVPDRAIERLRYEEGLPNRYLEMIGEYGNITN